MGIDTGLRKYIQESVAQKAWCASNSYPSGLTDLVVIDDLLPRLFKMIGPHYNYMFTGLELYAAITKPLRRLLSSPTGFAYVLLCDDPTFVPVEKSLEQSGRDAGAGGDVKPYDTDKGLELVDEGIKAADKSAAEMFDVRRFVRTRSLRSKLCDYVAKLFRENETMPKGKLLIMDYKGDNIPVVFGTPKDDIKDKIRKHRHGESDPSMAFWALQFKDYPIVFETTDSDLMPITACLSQKTDISKMKMYWRYDSKNLVNIGEMLLTSMKGFRINAKVFTLLCILTGTDYFKKKGVMHGFGVKKIISTVTSMSAFLERFGANEEDDNSIMRMFLFSIYGSYLPSGLKSSYFDQTSTDVKHESPASTDDDGPDKKKKKQEQADRSEPAASAASAAGAASVSIEVEKEDKKLKPVRKLNWSKLMVDLRPRCPKSSKPPDEKDIDKATKMIRFNYDYWMRFDIAC